jgi:uncharacterized PurR-regulated membrane protein YhhQ (DUF165 family)
MAEALVVCLLVLAAHALRQKAGLVPFYALLGALTAIMSWVTDAGAVVEFAGINFLVGSTVFYTSILLGVFVVYVFDGPGATRVAILTVAGVSVLTPVLAHFIQWQMELARVAAVAVPQPALRINSASVLTTVVDLVFLAMAWEVLGSRHMNVPLWLRASGTLLAVMWLDVFLFNTLAFAGKDHYVQTMMGTFSARTITFVFAWPILYLYLLWQGRRDDSHIQNRPVLAILMEMAEVRSELSRARQEIVRRKKAEREKEEVIEQLNATMRRMRRLEGLLPVCSSCKRIRLEGAEEGHDRWIPLEDYVRDETEVRFSHGLCQDCMKELYPNLPPGEEAGE